MKCTEIFSFYREVEMEMLNLMLLRKLPSPTSSKEYEENKFFNFSPLKFASTIASDSDPKILVWQKTTDPLFQKISIYSRYSCPEL